MDIAGITGLMPAAVTAAVVLVVILTEITKKIVGKIEEKLEARLDRQVKIFDHKKIWIALFWDVAVTVSLVIGGLVQKEAFLFYLFMIMGLSTFFYEALIRRIRAWQNEK